MNFLEAIASGHPFKRLGWHGYVTGIRQGQHVPFTAEACSIYWKDNSKNGSRHHVNVEELLATDWVLAPKVFSFTEKQLREAVSKHACIWGTFPMNSNLEQWAQDMASEIFREKENQ